MNNMLQVHLIEARKGYAAEAIAAGRPEDGERLYKQALAQAENLSDQDSLVGSVLLELFDLYEKQGRHDEARPVWARIRAIFIKLRAQSLDG
jgi:hypothetical protein